MAKLASIQPCRGRAGNMHNFSSEQALDLDALRTRLQKMSDAELRRFGRASRYMCSPEASFGKPPRENFVTQLKEAEAEWRRRHGGIPEP